MGLGYYKSGVWVPLLPDSADSVEYANIDTGFMVGKGRPRNDTGTAYYGWLGGVATGYGNVSFSGSSPKSQYSLAAVHAPINISEFACRVATGVAGLTVDFYLHEADTDWQPTGSPITLGTAIDVSSAGEKVVTGLDVDLDPGRYLVELYVGSTGNPAFRMASVTALDSDIALAGTTGWSAFIAPATGPHERWENAGGRFLGGGSVHAAYFKWTYR